MTTISFFITSFIIILIPGTGVMFTISTGITQGKRASLFAALGCTLGILPHLCVSIALSSFLMEMNDKAFFILKLIGALYLLYLGIGMIRSKPIVTLEKSKFEETAQTIIRSGILINLLNPKLTLFFFSFLPQYAKSASNHYIAECLLYGFAFMILTLLIFIGYGLLAGLTNKFFINSPRRIAQLQSLFGIIFIGLAVQLASSSI